MKSVCLLMVGFFCAALLLVFPHARAEEMDTQEAIKANIEKLANGQTIYPAGISVAAGEILVSLYRASEFRPAWLDQENREALRRAIFKSREDGLDPSDYHWDTIQSLSAAQDTHGLTAVELAEFDIVLSDAFALLSYQLFHGKVNPNNLDSNWNFSKTTEKSEASYSLLSALDARSLDRFFGDRRLKHPYYLTLKSSLRSHREIQSSGGWGKVLPGPTLKPGMKDVRISSLRRRLAASGDFEASGTSNPLLYDSNLESAVKAFQERHGLEPDGFVGEKTLEVLNIPVEVRIDQIRANLERARWVLKDLGSDFVIVNIAGFYLRLIRNSEIAWESPVIVGTTYRKTPIFSAQMRYLEFNPTWTVPPTILREDIIPKAKADINFLAKNGFQVVDYQRNPIDVSSIDWENIRSDAFPYLIVQAPGLKNALGLVKFMFPNKHAVYIHDTPSRGLFDSASRTFSSGCIRVKDPFNFAEQLLIGSERWTQSKLSQIIDSKETTKVMLNDPITVLLLYWTVDPDPNGTVRFYEDVYDRDKALIEALNSPLSSDS